MRDAATYTINRFYSDDTDRRVIATGLTLAEAKEHCNNPDTESAGEFFDGYEAEL